MKIYVSAIFLSSIIFLVVDIIWLSYSVKYFYKPQIGSLLNEQPVIWAAVLFYFVYIFGISYIIIHPNIIETNILNIFIKGMIFGIVAYGTYNLTNMATIKNWSSTVVFVDMIWGGLLSGFSVSTAIYLSRKFFLI